MRLGEDSLTHEDISIRYLDKKRLFRATRQVDGVGMQPFWTATMELKWKLRPWSGGSTDPWWSSVGLPEVALRPERSGVWIVSRRTYMTK